VAFDIDRILREVDTAWAEELESVAAAMADAFYLKDYYWGNATIRKNGEIVPAGNRDIVDEGGLVNSQYKHTITVEETEFGWTEDDPELNHNGGINTYNGTRYYHTPRPWTQHAISGDSEAPLEYQRSDAILNVPRDFEAKLAVRLAQLDDD
jgi:hypothetical protein